MKIQEFALIYMLVFTIIPGQAELTAGSHYQEGESYSALLEKWKSVEDINKWVEQNFTYDMEKALRVSRAGNTDKRSDQILAPQEFVQAKSGICVDLARFGYETLKKISPNLSPKYLMIEFKPVERADSVLRLHWIVLYQRNGEYYTFADSNRPGVIAGPFESVESLVKSYEKFRKREVVAYKVLDSYKKSQKKKRSKQVK